MVMKIFVSAYTTFPSSRALLLAQQVLASICDAQSDCHTMTLNQICTQLAQMLIAKTLSIEDLQEEITLSAEEGRVSAELLDTQSATRTRTNEAEAINEESSHRLRLRDQQQVLDDARVANELAKMEEIKQISILKSSRKATAKRIVCIHCGADEGLCDCIAVQLRRQKKIASTKASQVNQAEEEEEEEDEEEEGEDDDGTSRVQDDLVDRLSMTNQSTMSKSSLKTKLDLDNPGSFLDPNTWPRLSKVYSNVV